jgi:hypothetical protein
MVMIPFARNRGRSLSISLIACAFAGGIVATASTPAWAGWSTPVQPPAECGSGNLVSGQRLALNGNGTWAIATYEQVGSTFNINVCTSSDGVNWTGPTVIGHGVAPAVAVAPNGKIVVVWQGGAATSPDEEASYKLAGGSWTTPVVLDSSPAGHPLVSMDSSGNAIAAWVPVTGAVKTASLPATGSWTATTTLSTAGYDIGLGTNSSGQAIVGVRTGHDGRILAYSGTILGGFGAGVDLAGTYAVAHHTIQIAMNAAGAAAMTWESGSGALIALRGTGGTWGTPVTWELTSHSGIGTAIDNTGNVIVAFGNYTGSGPIPVYGALHPAGGSWGAATLLSSLSDLGKPFVTGDPAGTFVVAWTNSSSTITALTIPPGGGLTGTTAVVSPQSVYQLTMIPGLGVLWTSGGGISTEPVN